MREAVLLASRKHRMKFQILAILLISIMLGIGANEYHQFEQAQNAMDALRKYDREYELETKQSNARFEVIAAVNIQALAASGLFTYKNVTLYYEIDEGYFRISQTAGPTCPLGRGDITNCQGWVKILLTQISDFSHRERYYWMAGISVGQAATTSLQLINYSGAPIYWHLYLYLVTR
ncbi:MAG TPA: hypothetical protein VJZ75_03970 [Candidatus Bathyarchaeia archaeon]|nr:hypothetical protein [Candidatus Bathyarchaeia archaeon]